MTQAVLQAQCLGLCPAEGIRSKKTRNTSILAQNTAVTPHRFFKCMILNPANNPLVQGDHEESMGVHNARKKDQGEG